MTWDMQQRQDTERLTIKVLFILMKLGIYFPIVDIDLSKYSLRMRCIYLGISEQDKK